MGTLKISLLGQFRVCHGQQCLTRLPTSNTRRLLYYLLLFRDRRHSRHVLADLFWGETLEEQARGSLRTSLWRLRAFLGPDGAENGAYLIVDRDEIGFNTSSDYWLDVESFEDASAASDPRARSAEIAREEEIARLTQAVSLYTGELLTDCYDDWCLRERERLKELYLRDLTRLMVLHRERGAFDEALRCGQGVLAYEPLMEEVHRAVMALHCLAGNRASALRQYFACRRVLADELGVEPMEETTALYRRFLCDDAPTSEANAADDRSRPLRPPVVPLGHPTAMLDDAFSELRHVEQELHYLHARLQHSLERFDVLVRLVDPASSEALVTPR